MQTQSEVFLQMTATAWTAVGAIVSAATVIVISVFNALTLRAAIRAARAAESQAKIAKTSLSLLEDQLKLTQRPFIAIHAEYSDDIAAPFIYAHNQGNGPAIDVEAVLIFEDETRPSATYSIGCLAVDAKFQFLIGDDSNELSKATIWYKSIIDQEWTTCVTTNGGLPLVTRVEEGYQGEDEHHRRLRNFINIVSQSEDD